MRHASGRGPRTFDPVAVGHHETSAWAAYYLHEWPTFLRGAYGMVAAGFGLGPVDTARAAWWVLRANQLWAPYPDNDADGARDQMRRFYALVADRGDLPIDPVRASALEVEWWRVHRAHQHHENVTRDQLVAALVDLYAYVYSAEPERVEAAARHRVEAMDLSDRWVEGGCDRSDPVLAAERRALVASHSALLDAVSRVGEAAP
jgi:hypothetical protein